MTPLDIRPVNSIAVVGAGTMGQGIAQMAAMARYKVLLFDVNSDALETALSQITKNLDIGIEKGKVTQEEKENALSQLHLVSDLKKVKADCIIEAIVEDLKIKRNLFSRLEKINHPEAIMASNTSSIPITRLAAGMKHPERFVGMHFFNPAHIMKLVEVIEGAATIREVVDITMDIAIDMQKVPALVKDSPGFIVNRVARHFYVESLKILEEQVSDVEGIDKILKASGFKMGPFELMDLIGVDTNYSVTESMFHSFHHDPKFRPSRIQQQKVDAGHHGRKTGKGFYTYDS
jgi:3-hydroxybutyryl-CoA dehydrogenase